jgi:hypothetical protein
MWVRRELARAAKEDLILVSQPQATPSDPLRRYDTLIPVCRARSSIPWRPPKHGQGRRGA